MFKFLSLSAISLILSTASADAARVTFRFISEPSTRTDTEFEGYETYYFSGYEGTPITAFLELEVEDPDNINVAFSWNTRPTWPYGDLYVSWQDTILSSGGNLLDAWAGVSDERWATGYAFGYATITTDPDGSHQFSIIIADDHPDFVFTTDRGEWGSSRPTPYYTAAGYWEKTVLAAVPLPASAPLLLGGLTVLTAAHRRRRRRGRTA